MCLCRNLHLQRITSLGLILSLQISVSNIDEQEGVSVEALSLQEQQISHQIPTDKEAPRQELRSKSSSW